MIPVLILILNFSSHEAIPLSKLMIFCGSITFFIVNLRTKHPYRDGSNIDFNIASAIIPMVLFGTLIGVTLNQIMPNWIILLLLTVVLVINSILSIRK